ncbi:MAG: L-idonate 5-dehydrogenase [Geminicoccaceae bacterium]|nr:L-idonate 5-dehydrogenase [Geminicoccaceae bacterium]MCB9943395.1 L-idonate 5-dehydrogenase [Geminicoccaceae bacterium]
MISCVIHGAKDLRLEERTPARPGPGQVSLQLAAGGICGSDLHYYKSGAVGEIVLREPLVLGHEMAGVIDAVGDGVEDLHAGMRVAVNPSRPCNACRYCLAGKRNHCERMLFNGSAMYMPHTQGLFEELTLVEARQCRPVNDDLPLSLAALAEPFAVTLHAVNRAGPILGKTVMITGAGPIGCLAVAAARLAGASRIIATDLMAAPLETARMLGADEVIDLSRDADTLGALGHGKGSVDVVIECSASLKALEAAVTATAPRGVIVQVGALPGGPQPILGNRIMAKEIDLRGSFRFDPEFDAALALMAAGRVDLTPLLSHSLPLGRAHEAFELALDRNRAMKVQLVA